MNRTALILVMCLFPLAAQAEMAPPLFGGDAIGIFQVNLPTQPRIHASLETAIPCQTDACPFPDNFNQPDQHVVPQP